MRIKLIITTICIAQFFAMCKSKEQTVKQTNQAVKPAEQDTLQEQEIVIETAPPKDYFYRKDGYALGTILDYSKLDGCTWMIMTDDSTLLRPMNLDSTFQQNKLKVWVKYKPTKPMVSVCMAGKSVYILQIEPKHQGKY